jgi:hypothetical protein
MAAFCASSSSDTYMPLGGTKNTGRLDHTVRPPDSSGSIALWR